jgi:uncharacterized protein (DUF736 family)
VRPALLGVNDGFSPLAKARFLAAASLQNPMTQSLSGRLYMAVSEDALGSLLQPEKENIMAIIGQFTKTENGFKGVIQTLAVKAETAFERNGDKQQDNHPDYDILAGDTKIGAAWERTGKHGRYLSVSFDDPSFAPGFYSLYKTGSSQGYTLTFERARAKKTA